MDFENLAVFAARAIALLIAIPFHEAAHAFAAYKLGDSTAKNLGRMSLNPVKHFDPLGALCMILVGFGWAKPVPVAAVQRFKNPKRDMALSAFAGPVANILLAFVFMAVYKVFLYSYYNQLIYISSSSSLVSSVAIFINTLLISMISINIVLAAFNLLPIPPLDGSKIAFAFLPRHIYFNIMRYERYIIIALFAMLYFGVLNYPISFLQNFIFNLLDNGTKFIDLFFELVIFNL